MREIAASHLCVHTFHFSFLCPIISRGISGIELAAHWALTHTHTLVTSAYRISHFLCGGAPLARNKHSHTPPQPALPAPRRCNFAMCNSKMRAPMRYHRATRCSPPEKYSQTATPKRRLRRSCTLCAIFSNIR
jgi:hypothetical protein